MQRVVQVIGLTLVNVAEIDESDRLSHMGICLLSLAEFP